MRNFKTRIKEKNTAVGTIITLPAPAIAEMCADVGFDWLFLDMEHGTLDIKDIQHLSRAAGTTPCLVRIPEQQPEWIKRVLDTGVDGVIVPHVNTPEQAAWVVRQAKYPPVGERSIGAARAHRYGLAFDDYLKNANDRTTVIIQIEHIDAVSNVNAILDVRGIDAIFIGPFDLSASMGVPGKIDAPPVIEAIAKVCHACRQRAMPVGIFCPSLGAAQKAIRDEYNFIAAGSDVTLLSALYRKTLSAINEENPCVAGSIPALPISSITL